MFFVISGEREKDLGDDARELEAIEEGISFKSVFNHMNITKPSTLKGKSVGKYLEDIQWTEEMGKRLENFWKEGKHYQFCSKPGLKRVVLDVSLLSCWFGVLSELNTLQVLKKL